MKKLDKVGPITFDELREMFGEKELLEALSEFKDDDFNFLQDFLLNIRK